MSMINRPEFETGVLRSRLDLADWHIAAGEKEIAGLVLDLIPETHLDLAERMVISRADSALISSEFDL